MRIRRVEVENYKGIKSADWRIPPDKAFFCLIGPGDSSKSTLLEAMHLALTDRWNLSINDTDFYMGDTTKPIMIRVTVTGLPNELQQHNLLGFHLSGVNKGGDYQHDPGTNFEPCVIIQLKLDKDVEPSWTIFRPDDEGDPVPIGAGVRRRFDVFKVDDRIDIHLRWSKMSALSRLTDATHGTAGTLAAAIRAAREAVFESVTPALSELTQKIQAEVNTLGGGDFHDMRPGLDNSLTTSSGNLALFEGNVPMTNYGLGTRRLAGIATQQMAVSSGAILLVDEVEHGLEPHRLVHLLRHFKDNPLDCQIFITTHSPVAVEQLAADDLVIVRSTDGHADAKGVPATLAAAQGSLRAGPSAFLARRVIVTEGKTEHGLFIGLLQLWDAQRAQDGQPPSAALGSAIQDGRGGSTAPVRAKLLQDLGYSTALFMDNDDRSVDAAVEDAATAGALVVQWQLGHATEQELTHEVSAEQLSDIVQLARQTRIDERTILDDLNRMTEVVLPDLSVANWITDGLLDLSDARALVGRTAKKYKWFKTVDGGIALAGYVHSHWAEFEATAFCAALVKVRDFMLPSSPAASTGSTADG